ncbi:GNAT family N-acetyltransferase [Gilvibacter sp.]|uniref:GNAT family N-acetyltransferase n=1 Tax=Gilvibacter sp. TaxID=2729997 RepID=UPI003F49DAA3
MSTYRVAAYRPEWADAWNQLVSQAKNATFLFHRSFMEYHADRFKDASQCIFKGDKLVGLFPANLKEDQWVSHGGLSYGGLVVPPSVKFNSYVEMLIALFEAAESQGITQVVIKAMPDIYCSQPSQELDYLSFIAGAKTLKIESASTIDLRNPMPIQSNRYEGVKKAKKLGLTIKQSTDFKGFWDEILIPNLEARHEAKPVHTAEEIAALQLDFPENIHLFLVYDKTRMVGGCVVFETSTTAHVQYIAAGADRQQLGTLDLLFDHLILMEFDHLNYFDFGISTVDGGLELNSGLLYWKECFGARTTANKTYGFDPKQTEKLKGLL